MDNKVYSAYPTGYTPYTDRYTAYKINCLIEASNWMKIEKKTLESEIKGSTKAITEFKDVPRKIRMFCSS